MADNETELVLRISGDSAGGQEAVSQLVESLTTLGAAAVAGAAPVQALSDGLTQAVTAPAGGIQALTDGLQQVGTTAASTADETATSWRTAWDDFTAKTYNAVADSGESIKGLGETITQAIENPMQAAKGAVTGALEELGPYGVALAAVGGAAIAAGAALYELADSAAETVEGMGNFSRITGESLEGTATLAAQAEILGTSLDRVQSMLVMMQRRMDSGAASSAKFDAALADLNIDADAFRAADPSDRINILSDAFQHASGSVNLMTDGLAIMGRSFLQFMPALLKNTQDVRDSAKDLSITLSEDTVHAAEKLEVESGKLSQAWTQLKTNMGTALAPPVTAVVEAMNVLVGSSQKEYDLLLKIQGVQVFGPPGAPIAQGPGAPHATPPTPAIDDPAYTAAMAHIAELYDSLTVKTGAVDAATRGWVIDLQKLGTTNADIATATGLSSGQVNAIEVAYAKAAKATDAWRTAVAAARTVIEGESKAMDVQIAAIRAVIDEQSKDPQVIANTVKAIETLLSAHGKLSEAMKTSLLDLQTYDAEHRVLQGSIDLSATRLNMLSTDVLPPLTGRLSDNKLALDAVRDADVGLVANGLVPLVSHLQTFSGGVTIAGDTLDHVLIPAFTTLATGAVPQMSAAIKKATNDIVTSTVTWRTAFGDVNSDIQQIGQIAGGTFGTMVKDIGAVVSASEKLATALGGLGGSASGGAAGGASGVSSLLGGLSAGAVAVGAAWLGVGIAVYGFISSLMAANAAAQQANYLISFAQELSREWSAVGGTADQFSVSLTNSILASQTWLDQMGSGFGGIGADALNLSAIITELGGTANLTATQLVTVAQNIQDLFKMVAAGGPVGMAALKELDTVTAQMGADEIAATGLVSQSYLDTIAQAKAAGITLTSVNAQILTAAQSGATGLNSVLTGLQASSTASAQAAATALGQIPSALHPGLETISEMQTRIAAIVGPVKVTQTEFDGLAAATVADFATMMKGGMSFTAALAAIQPSITGLQKAMADSGVSGSATFSLLSNMSKIAGNAIEGPLASAIQGVNTGLQGLHNAGILNQTMFTGGIL